MTYDGKSYRDYKIELIEQYESRLYDVEQTIRRVRDNLDFMIARFVEITCEPTIAEMCRPDKKIAHHQIKDTKILGLNEHLLGLYRQVDFIKKMIGHLKEDVRK